MGCGASTGHGGELSIHSDDHTGMKKTMHEMSMKFGYAHKHSLTGDGKGEVTRVTLSRPRATPIPVLFRTLLQEHARFLVNFVAILERSSGGENSESRKQVSKMPLKPIQRPTVDTFAVKSHWMDNVRARKMCDEMLHLEDPAHPLPDPGKGHGGRNTNFMRTLQLSLGQQVNVLKMSNNPEVSIGGYFIISQMLSYIKSLVSLDLSSNNLTAAAARVLSLGLKANHSIQELRMKDNTIGSEGATSMSDMLKVNNTLLLMDLRMNCIRGAGVCVLADAVSENKSLTELDMRWNYAGECSDFVEMALVDLKDFCFRNMVFALEKTQPATPELDPNNPKIKELHFNGNNEKFNADGSENSSPQISPSTFEGSTQNLKVESKVESFYNSPDLFADQEPIGRLEVTILSARNLPQVIWTSGKDGEFMGLPQAYCTFTLNKQTTTTAITKKDWAPTWNHTVSIDVRQVWQVCSLKVMHSKSLNHTHLDDYAIGNVNIPVGAVINWRGVTLGADQTWRACHRPLQAGPGTIYQACRAKAKDGEETDAFETAEQAARAYDDTARKKDNERAHLNLSGEYDYIGQHVKDELYPLNGEDGISVIGVQAGVPSAVRLRLKFFSAMCNYLEIHLDKATSLPKMDTGLGTCDAYCHILVGDYHFHTRVVRNSLDPAFRQTFRIAILDAEMPLDLKVQVWDWDKWNEDDHMGDSLISINSIADVNKQTFNTTYTVKKPDGAFLENSKKEQSLLHMRFTFWAATHQEHEDLGDEGDRAPAHPASLTA